MTTVAVSFMSGLRAGVPRADQLLLYHQMKGETVSSLIADSLISWNRVQYASSCGINGFSCDDIVLYRPGTYLIQILLVSFLTHSFALWQLLSLIVHVLVVAGVYQLLRQLSHLKSTFTPMALASVVGVGFPGSEMIYWNHLIGYTIFAALVVWSASLFVINQRQLRSEAHLYIASGLAVVSQFFYELGFIFVLVLVMVFAYLSQKQPSARHFKVVTILGIGAVIYLFSNLYSASQTLDSSSFRNSDRSVGLLLRAISAAFAHFSYQGAEFLKPTISHFVVGDRLIRIVNPSYTSDTTSLSMINAAFIICIALCAVIATLQASRRSSQAVTLQLAVCGIATILLVTYYLILAAGRSLPRGIEYTLGGNAYYSYFFVLLLVIALGALVLGISPVFDRAHPTVAGLTCGVCLALVVMHAPLTYDLGVQTTKYLAPRQRMVDSIIDIRNRQPDTLFQFTFESQGSGLQCPTVDGLEFQHLKKRLQTLGVSSYADILFPELSSRYRPEQGSPLREITWRLPCPHQTRSITIGR